MNACTLLDNTTPSAVVNAYGCAVLARDTSSCQAARVAQGLSGDWLKFSCRVTLTVVNNAPRPYVLIQADDQPDSLSNYFDVADPCYENYQVPGIPTPNKIAVQSVSMKAPITPNALGGMAKSSNSGVAINGVWLFNDAAAPPDDIYKAINSFDRCAGHPDPQNGGTYHYHIEPSSISNDDSSFIGVEKDGYFLYGRRDMDNSLPVLDVNGGHTGFTTHSPNVAVYHYHLVFETSMNVGSAGQTAWFVATGKFHGALIP